MTTHKWKQIGEFKTPELALKRRNEKYFYSRYNIIPSKDGVELYVEVLIRKSRKLE